MLRGLGGAYTGTEVQGASGFVSETEGKASQRDRLKRGSTLLQI